MEMGEQPAHFRWPRLTQLAEDPATRSGLHRLLDDCGWVYTPSFLDSGEQALSDLETWATDHASRSGFFQEVTGRIKSQTDHRQCLDAIVEACAAAWLARHDALVPDQNSTPSPSSVIDLCARVGPSNFGVEVKSDFDAFEAEFMSGGSRDDPNAVHPRLRERFGADARIQFRWIGKRPPREGWGPIRRELGRQVGLQIPRAPDLVPGKECHINARLEEPIQGCYGLRIVIASQPLVHVSFRVGTEGWEEVERRIRAHARSKSEKTDQSFVLLYVSQPPQVASLDAGRLQRASREFRDPKDLPKLLGAIHLRLPRSGDSGMEASGFARGHWDYGEAALEALRVRHGQLASPRPLTQ